MEKWTRTLSLTTQQVQTCLHLALQCLDEAWAMEAMATGMEAMRPARSMGTRGMAGDEGGAAIITKVDILTMMTRMTTRKATLNIITVIAQRVIDVVGMLMTGTGAIADEALPPLRPQPRRPQPRPPQRQRPQRPRPPQRNQIQPHMHTISKCKQTDSTRLTLQRAHMTRVALHQGPSLMLLSLAVPF